MARILIADPDETYRSSFREEAVRRGYEVYEAKDGDEAWERIRKSKSSFDCIVIEPALPIVDGIDLMSRIVAKDNKARIVLNTKYPTYRDNYLTSSADAFVLKGTMKEALDAVEEVVRRVR